MKCAAVTGTSWFGHEQFLCPVFPNLPTGVSLVVQHAQNVQSLGLLSPIVGFWQGAILDAKAFRTD